MTSTSLNLDERLFLALNFDGGDTLDRFFHIVSGRLTWIPLYLLIVVLLWRRYGWRYTLLALVFIALAVGACDQVANLFKNGIQKFRPTHDPDLAGMVHTVNNYLGGRFGTVSAHAATTFAILTVSSTLIRARWFTVLGIVWVLLVAYSRIYLGMHFPLDILLGATLGIIMGVVAVKLLRFTAARLEIK